MNLQVRATNLQELVYKNGQAGVSKATVSITFDNKDKKQTPLGYEQYDEITVTRQVWKAAFDSIMISLVFFNGGSSEAKLFSVVLICM